MPSTPAKEPNSYFIDPENAAEMARLMHQDRLTTQGMKGTFPERADLTGVHDILDVGCGPGGWVLDVAYDHQKISVTGVDISRVMIEYARAQAFTQGLDNAHFRVMDATKPLGFPDASFDIVNARFISGFMPPAAWSALMNECARVLRPGGIMRLTESDWHFTNSLAYEMLNSKLCHAMKEAGKSFSPDGRNVSMTPMLGQFFQQAHYRNIQHQAHMLDYSAGTAAREAFIENSMAFFRLIKPFMLKFNVTNEQEFEELYNQMVVDAMLDTFRCIAFVLTMWGEKP